MQKSHLATSNVKEIESWLVPWQLVLKGLACALYTEILHTDSFCYTGARFHTDSLCCRSWLVHWKLVLGYGLCTVSFSARPGEGLFADSSISRWLVHWQLLLGNCLSTGSFYYKLYSTVTASDALTASTGRWLVHWKKLLLGYGLCTDSFYWEMACNGLYTGSIY